VNHDPGLWGPPMPFYEAVGLSRDGVAGLFDELPDDYPEDAPGTVLNVTLHEGEPRAINGNHYQALWLDEHVRECKDWRAFHPKDAVTRLGEAAP